MVKDHILHDAKKTTISNLILIRANLSRCVEAGMVDAHAEFYNELLSLEDEASLSSTWDELVEVITKAKTLETDVAVWLAGRGQTSIAIPWPRAPVS